MFSCMGSQLDMGDRETKALRKVHCYCNSADYTVILKCYKVGYITMARYMYFKFKNVMNTVG